MDGGKKNKRHSGVVVYNANMVKELMNVAGSARKSFLFAVDFELERGLFIESPLNQQDVLFDVAGKTNIKIPVILDEERFFHRYPVTEEEYERRFQIAREGLLRGDSFLLNLTVSTGIEMGWTLEDIFFRSNSPYRLYVPDCFVCFSPEIFVKIIDGKISSFPMKGTISASIPNAEQVILEDYKETAEHNTIVDLIRNDLNQVAEDVNVKRFRYMNYLDTSNGKIIQVSSEVIGQLPDDYCAHLGDIIFRLLPAGSISGAPKSATLDIITRAEGERRGFYTGVFGYFDGQALDSAVMIRFIEEREGKFYFRSGGGITVNSNVRDEYKEVLEKVYLPF